MGSVIERGVSQLVASQLVVSRKLDVFIELGRAPSLEPSLANSFRLLYVCLCDRAMLIKDVTFYAQDIH